MDFNEFAFFNQQLGSMLKDGIPLEGAIERLSRSMKKSKLKRELESLHDLLAKGTPLENALERVELPSLYVYMVKAGVKSGNLPGILIMVADYYQKAHSLGVRLKGLLTYPVLLLVFCIIVSTVLSATVGSSVAEFAKFTREIKMPSSSFETFQYGIWMPPLLLLAILLLFIASLTVWKIRVFLRWSVSPFKEISLVQVSSIIGTMLYGGCTLTEAIQMVSEMEKGTRAGAELEIWQNHIQNGESKFADIAEQSVLFPPLFVWLVSSYGEDLAKGFKEASKFYYERASHRIEIVMYGVLPISILIMAFVVMGQTYAIINGYIGPLTQILKQLG